MTEQDTHLNQIKSIRDWLSRLIDEMENGAQPTSNEALEVFDTKDGGNC